MIDTSIDETADGYRKFKRGEHRNEYETPLLSIIEKIGPAHGDDLQESLAMEARAYTRKDLVVVRNGINEFLTGSPHRVGKSLTSSFAKTLEVLEAFGLDHRKIPRAGLTAEGYLRSIPIGEPVPDDAVAQDIGFATFVKWPDGVDGKAIFDVFRGDHEAWSAEWDAEREKRLAN